MSTIREKLRKTPLRALYQWQRRVRRNFLFRRKFEKVVANPDIRLDDLELLEELSYGWGNVFALSAEFLADLVEYTAQAKYPILDCGSGLSTIIAGLAAKRYGKTIWSLEDSKLWYNRVKHYLEKYEIDSVKLLYCPLKKYPDFTWYDVPPDTLPEKFSLVSCDGPTHQINADARRYALFPMMKERFAPECIILFDNEAFKQEQEGLYYWLDKLRAQYEKGGTEKIYLKIKMP